VRSYTARGFSGYSNAGEIVNATDNQPKSGAAFGSLSRKIIFCSIVFIVSCCHAGVGILSYDTPAYIDFEQQAFLVSEDQGTLTIGVSRTGEYRQTAKVDFNLVEGTATEGRDYKAAGGTLVFAPGEGFKTIIITILKDDEAEPDENFTVEFSNPSANAFLMHTSTTIVIRDAPPLAAALPSLAIQPRKDGTVAISWDKADGCVLERSTTLGSGNWVEVAAQPVLDNGRYVVVEPITNTLCAYRLRSN
jgi:hypothetical protein